MTDPEQIPTEGKGRFRAFASENKLFSGIVGSALVALVAIGIAVSDDRGSSRPAAGKGSGPTSAARSPETKPAEATKAVWASDDTSLGDYIEAEEPASYSTENTTVGPIAVDGIVDPLGIRMELDEAYRSGALTIPTEGAFEAIHGQVGITSDPCSPGSVGEVAIRGPEGEQLWPKSGEPQPVGRKPLTFDVPIGSKDEVVLYASAPLAEEGRCGAFLDSTEIGWVHTQLIAPE